MSQTKIFNRQKDYTSPICCHFLQQNLIIRMYFLPICNNFLQQNFLDYLVFNNLSRINHSYPRNNSVKTNTSLNYSL